MIDFEWIAARLWASVVAVMLGVFFLSMAPKVSAATFNKCTPSPQAWEFLNDPQEQEKAKQREQVRCDAENAILESWAARLNGLDNTKEKIGMAANLGNWVAFRAALGEVRKPFFELQRAATDTPDAEGAAAVRSLFGQDLTYFFQNVGMTAPTSLDEALTKIEAAANTPGQESKAATLAVTILNNASSRAFEMAVGLGKAAGNKVQAETMMQGQAVANDRRDKLEGRTFDGYFGGFTERLLRVWKPWLTILLFVTFGGSWWATRRRLNPVTAGAAAGLAYLIPGTVMAGGFVALPFLPQWLMIAATLAGTAATYLFAGPVFEWLAARAGVDSPTGKRLATLGGTLENLRAGLGGSPTVAPGTDVVGQMAAAQATHGSARWGTSIEMRQGGHLVAPGKPAGFALARVPDAPADVDPRFRFDGHVVTVAPTGSGKGIGAVIPNLLDYPGSALVLDVKGENSAVTARARRELGHKVFVVDPFGVNKGSEAHAFNLLDRLNPSDPECVSESAILADCLVIPDEKGGGKHFDESAKTLLQGLMLHVVALDDPARRNLGEVRRLLTADEETFLATLADMAADEAAAFSIPARAANTIMGMADRERGSVLSTAKVNTAFLDDPRIVAAVSRSDFDLANIKAELMTVYLVLPANKIGPNARFVRAFIGSVIAAITSSTTQPLHRVAFLLDEFGQLGYMKQIEDAVSLLRGYGLAFWVFIQDLSQLKGVYPKWQTFLANSAKTFYGTDDYDTAKYVSDSLGQATIEYETHNQGRSSGNNFSGSDSGGSSGVNRGKSTGISQQLAGRHLLTPDEVMRLGPERPIVLVKGEYPYQLTRLNYLVDAEYVGKADLNPYHS